MIRQTLPPCLLASVVLFASAALAAPAPSEPPEVPIPKGAPPTLTVARMTKEGALVRLVAVPVVREETYSVERVIAGGGRVIETRKVLVSSVEMVEQTTVFKGLRASYANGTKVDPKKLPALLAKRTLVLVVHSDPVDPVYLRAFKDTTLVLILPRLDRAPLDKDDPRPKPFPDKKLPK